MDVSRCPSRTALQRARRVIRRSCTFITGPGLRTPLAPCWMEDVRIDHRRRDVAVAEELLHGADVVAPLEEVRRERVAEGVAGTRLSILASSAARVTARCMTVSCRWWRPCRPVSSVQRRVAGNTHCHRQSRGVTKRGSMVRRSRNRCPSHAASAPPEDVARCRREVWRRPLRPPAPEAGAATQKRVSRDFALRGRRTHS